MANGDKKVAIKLEVGEEDDVIIETKNDGNKQAYYPNQFAVHWICENLKLHKNFGDRTKDDLEPPKMLTYITGIARLKYCYGLSVIGEPNNTTIAVELSIRPDDSLDLLKMDEEKPKKGILGFSQLYGCAMMGFNRADREIRSNDKWWLECRLHSAALQPLIDTISNATLENMSLSVCLNGVFTHESPYVPFSRERHIFLRPDIRDNTINFPEVASGWVEGIWLDLKPVDVVSPPKPESVCEIEHEPKKIVYPDILPTVQVAQLLANRIDALRETIRLVGGLMVVIFLLLLFK